MAENSKGGSELDIVLVVHGVSTVPMGKEAIVNGEKMMVSVDCVEVEFVTEGDHGSFTTRYIGKAAALARAKFQRDSRHVWTP